MDKSSAIMDLVAGYETYSEAEELNTAAASEAPQTTPACLASAASTIAYSAYKTYNDGC